MGNLGQNLTGKYQETISFEQAEIQTLSPADALATVKDKLKEDSFHNVLYSLKIADKLDTQFRLLLPLSIEKEIAEFNKKLNEAKALEPKAESSVDKSIQEPKERPVKLDNLDMILDLKVEIVVKLGETVRPLSEITDITSGNILSLDKASNAPVDIIVNNKTIAKGELIVIPPYNFAIKVTEIKGRLDRIKNLALH
jgi:flagellar motor switch protein FliN/FliY